jgi:hypothetical protein
MTDEDVIRFKAQVIQVRTLADGGLRFVLDVDETEIETASKLMRVKQAGGVLEVAAVAIALQKENNAIPEGSKRKSKWSPSENKGTN